MATLRDLLDKLAQLESFILDGKIDFSEEDEMVTKQLIGGQHTKKSGNKVLVVRIPYSLTEEYVLGQLFQALQKKTEYEALAKAADEAIERIKSFLPTGNKGQP